MGLFSNLFTKRRCYICGQHAKQPQHYFDDKGNKVKVCYKCVSYAERRALRKI